MRYIKVVPRTDWRNKKEALMGNAEAMREISDLSGIFVFDWPFIISFVMLLQVPQTLEFRETNLAWLNSKRSKRGNMPLNDYIEVVSQLSGNVSYPGRLPVSGSNTGKSSPWLHVVRKHLVRRGDKIFWRNMHFRGRVTNGKLATKTVTFRSK